MTDPTAHLRVLGEPSLEWHDGTEADLPLGKPFALLVYVVLSPEPPSRETLGRIFWPDSSRDRARGSVRQALWLLRSTLGDDLFVSDDPVEIRDGAVRTDVEELRAALARDNAERAHALWRGPPLDALSLHGLPEWERWIETLRSELEQRLAEGAALRGNRERDAGRVSDALLWLRRAREIQPHRVQHHIDLAQTLLESRRFDEAQEALLAARRNLVDEQDVEAVAELEDRLQTVRRGSLGDPLEDGSLRLEFVGRSEEYGTLVRRWRQARNGRAAVGVVVGEDGIGKTRLTEEIALLARTEGGRTVQVRAADGERPIEWGLLGELVQQLMALSGAAGISHASDGMLRALLPSLWVGEPPRTGQAARTRGSASVEEARPSAALSDALHDLVTAVSEDAPLLIVIDDLHWADAESRAILARVATHLEDVPVFLLVTCRACDQDARVEKTLALLASAGSGATIHPGLWKPEEIQQLLGQVVSLRDTEEEREAVELIARVTRGVPSHVLEMVGELERSGIIEKAEGDEVVLHVERLRKHPPLPEGMRRWLGRAVPELTAPALAVADCIARAGGPLSPTMVAQRAELAPEAVGSGIGELLDLRLAFWHEDDRLELIHPELARTVVRRADAVAAAKDERRSAWSGAKAAILAALALVGVTSGTYLFGDPGATRPPRIGGGTLFVVGADSTYAMDAFGGPAPEWETGEADAWHPVGPNVVGPFRSTSGQLHWFENRFAAGTPSWILDLGSDGNDSIVVRQRRDHAFLDLSPSGRFFLSISPNPNAPDLRDDLRISWRERLRTWTFHRASGKILSGDWSDDARAAALAIRGPEGDSLIVLGVTGERLNQRGFDEIYNAVWCGNSIDLVVSAYENGAPRLMNWDIEEDVVRILPSTGVLGTGLACAPDGSAVVFQTAMHGVPKYQLLDLATGEISRIPIPEGVTVEQLRWVPDRIEAVPITVSIHEGESLTMEWGDRVRLGADLILSDGERMTGGVTWSADNPEVASITAEGDVTANTAGTTVIRAQYGRWLLDEIEVTVEGEPTAGTLFSSTLGTLDRGDWFSIGTPQARPVQVEDRSVLGLRGEGSEVTGVISTQSFALPRGGTIEADFHLPLPAPSDEGRPVSIRLCLLDADAPSTGNRAGLDSESFRSWNVRQQVCFAYPYGTVPRVDPNAAALVSHPEFPPVRAELAQPLLTDGWFHASIFLRLDGTARFFVNDTLVGTTPVQVRNDSGVRWRIAVFGSGGSEVDPLVRDLTLSVGGVPDHHTSDDEGAVEEPSV